MAIRDSKRPSGGAAHLQVRQRCPIRSYQHASEVERLLQSPVPDARGNGPGQSRALHETKHTLPLPNTVRLVKLQGWPYTALGPIASA